MTQNPYADAGDMSGAVYAEPERTSVTAVLSLVCSLVCCIPGLSILGTLLGIGALVGISGSRGRVGGKGLAVAGVIIGLLVTVLWVGAIIGARAMFGAYVGLVGPVLVDLEDGDFDAVRASFDPSTPPTDEQLSAFRAEYQGEFGSFQSVPSGAFEIIMSFADPQVGPLMQQYQGRNDMIPVPATFDQGKTLVLFDFDPTQQNQTPLFTDMVIVRPDGSEIRLSDFGQGAP